MAPATIFTTPNYGEAAVWIALAVALAAKAIAQVHVGRWYYLLIAAILLVFGLSQIAEEWAASEHWWQPWWLAVWKGACVVSLAALVFGFLRALRSRSRESAETRA